MVRIDWAGYKAFLEKNNRKEYICSRYNYAIKYQDCYANPSKILSIPLSIRANVLKAMVCLSKYLGEYLEFKEQLKQHGIKWSKPDNLTLFLNILNDRHDELAKWYKTTQNVLGENYKLFVRFILLSGMRKGECVKAFNLIIELSKNGKIDEYYSRELSILEHYKYPKMFLRGNKNVYISILPYDLIQQVANSRPVTYSCIRKYLQRRHIRLRLKELRSFFASYLRKHGIISELVDLIQGRISRDIFVRHYLKETPQNLSAQVLTLLKGLEDSLQSEHTLN